MSRGRRRTVVDVLLFVALVAVVLTMRSTIRAWLTPRLPVVTATRTGDGLAYRFDADIGDDPALVRVGPPPTPISIASSCGNDDVVLLTLYESLADLRVLVVDRATGAIDEVEVPGAALSYVPRLDRGSASTAWIPTSEPAALYAIDLDHKTATRRLAVDGESHVFGFDQGADGALYLGTYPNRRCLRVTVEGDATNVEEVVVDDPAIASCKYLHGIFAADDALYLNYRSPAVIVRHDLETGASVVLARAEGDTITFTPGPASLRIRGPEIDLHIDRAGRPRVDPAPPAPYRIRAGVGASTVEWEGGSATVPLHPRGGGMRVTCFEAMPDGRVYGGTYWNTWMFRIDPATRHVDGVGAVPGVQGEFFSLGWVDDEIAIPHYQWRLFRFDPARPYAAGGDDPNPRLIRAVPDAHFGRSCVTDAAGRLVYATTPNYHQRGGMLVIDRPDGTYGVVPVIGDDRTLDHLVLAGDAVYGGTVERTGLGRADASGAERRPTVVRIDAETGTLVETIAIDDRAGTDVRGLVAMSSSTLLALTAYRVHRIERGADGATVTRLGAFERLARTAVGHTRVLERYGPDLALVLTERYLCAVRPSSGQAAALCRMPTKFEFTAVDEEGGLWLADDGTIHFLPAAALRRLLERAGLQ
jgi:hypothetical protein